MLKKNAIKSEKKIESGPGLPMDDIRIRIRECLKSDIRIRIRECLQNAHSLHP